MTFDSRGIQIIGMSRDGYTYLQIAAALGITRQAIEYRMKKYPEFAEAVKEARDQGHAIRDFGLWFRHYRRGKRPPFGKGHGGIPRYGIKRNRPRFG